MTRVYNSPKNVNSSCSFFSFTASQRNPSLHLLLAFTRRFPFLKPELSYASSSSTCISFSLNRLCLNGLTKDSKIKVIHLQIHPDKIQVKQNAIGKLSELKPTGLMCLYNNYQL
ncbi:hypothetical protein HanXRQr2_Chr04g0186541 [Helianthus annuus]|uniref:Uncharacterized protein n=1 Tax=Helianthus annuus TaxID=4232 RepID=A0A9K3JAF3_HELAN|nr:hypothetical protein HanXRQr2_Chr04g0186541 [Helianthus annuus]KAJ0598487.1 hypothetical protein HanHA89_Chr04g0166371 [Helianthus annuus]KAJ0759087.1 hypothetical protein HanLR1_Chr04g0157621 [Helianthus annuus]KAJ0762736.1 hypothetical protein HanOQP8_Chr04g0164641 [Helianthus annuus]